MPVQIAIVACHDLIMVQGRLATTKTNDGVVLAISKPKIVGDFFVSRTCSVQSSGHLCRLRKGVCLLVCFDRASLFIFALLASFDAFKIVSDRVGKVESYWICLDEVTKKSA